MHYWIKQVLASHSRTVVPIMTHPGIEKLGKRVLDAVTDGSVHFEAIRMVASLYPSDACTVIMDLTVEAEAFGSELKMQANEVPAVVKRLVYDNLSVQSLKVPDLYAGRVQEYMKASKLAVTHIKDRPVFAGCIGPFSLAARLFDMSEIMISLYFEPQTIHLLLEKCTEFILSYCKALKSIGAAGVVIAEPAAGLLSNEDCMQFSTRYVKQLVDTLQDDTFLIILHNCGNSGQCTPAMLASGASALHFGNAVRITEVLEQCPPDILVMGNLDPVRVFKQASPQEVFDKTTELLNETGKYPNFVLSSGCDLPPFVPEENINAFFEAIKKYNNHDYNSSKRF